jgi:hypothetical protein
VWRRRRGRFRDDPELALGFASHLMLSDMTAAWLSGDLARTADLTARLPGSMLLVRPALALALAQAGRTADASLVLAECAHDDHLELRARTVTGRAELVFLGYAAAELGDAHTARRIYNLLRERQGQVAGWAGWAFWGAVDGLLGVLAASNAEFGIAIEHLEAALALHDRAGWRSLSATTAAELAAALYQRRHRDDRAKAASLGAKTEPIARELGLKGVQRRLAALAVRMSQATEDAK